MGCSRAVTAIVSPRSHMRTLSRSSSPSEAQSGSATHVSGFGFPPSGIALVRLGNPQHCLLVEASGGQLKADREALGRKAARDADGREAGEVGAHGEDV